MKRIIGNLFGGVAIVIFALAVASAAHAKDKSKKRANMMGKGMHMGQMMKG